MIQLENTGFSEKHTDFFPPNKITQSVIPHLYVVLPSDISVAFEYQTMTLGGSIMSSGRVNRTSTYFPLVSKKVFITAV